MENKYIIPEFLQFKCKPSLISKELIKLLDSSNAKNQIYKSKKSLLKLKFNNKLPSINAVKEIISDV